MAAEEAGWLVTRGYAAAAVSEFVARERRLSDEEQRLLACATRLRAQYAKHIARELEPEDVAKRPVRIDASSVLSAVDAALEGRPLVESPAGVLSDPTWRRASGQVAALDAAVERVEAALGPLRPSVVRWYVDESAPWASRLEELVSKKKKSRAKIELARVEDAGAALRESAYVASADPDVLDDCACWLNLVGRAIGDLSPPRIRLEG